MVSPKIINSDAGNTKYLRLLGGPPDSITMRSGRVVLQPNESIGEHSTNQYEELIVILDGEGLFLIEDGMALELNTNTVAYCPPETKHNIKNTGIKPLVYIYIVAKAI
jgi:mannose-6-phosphate isomerase-like protein (cupin superfamily)